MKDTKTIRTRVVSIVLAAIMLFGLVCAVQTGTGKAYEAYATGVNGDIVRGVWIASVMNIDFPSKPGLSVEQIKSEIKTILNNVEKSKLTDVFLQVRPTGDALYNSKIFPVSEYLSGTQGTCHFDMDEFDPLEYWIAEAHKKGIRIHAWINPYRITRSPSGKSTQLSQLSKNNPAKLHPDWTVKYADGQIYYNPGIPEVRSLVFDGIMELVDNYDIDGIHMDDYFYPYPVNVKNSSGKSVKATFDDSATYKKYGSAFKNIDDWRRDNVNSLVRGIYEAIKFKNPSVLYGVSPFGIWALKKDNANGMNISAGLQSYYELYCDSRLWVKNDWVDYICPQIYWSMETTSNPFDKIYSWWADVCKNTNVKLIAGHGAYRIEKGASQGWGDNTQIERQLNYTTTVGQKSYGGNVFYGYSTIAANTLYSRDKIVKFYNEINKIYSPVTVSSSATNTAAPSDNNVEITSAPTNSDKAFLSRTIGGISETDLYTLRLTAPANNFKTTSANSFIMGTSDPSQKLYINGKEITYRSPGGFFNHFVALEKGTNNFSLTQGNSRVDFKITRGTVNSDGYYDEDNVIVTSTPTPQASVSTTLQKITNSYGVVKYDNTKIYTSSAGQLSMDFLPLAKGATANIVAKQGNYYKFDFGGWVYVSNIDVKTGKVSTLAIPSISAIETDTSFGIRFNNISGKPYHVNVTEKAVEFTIYGVTIKDGTYLPTVSKSGIYSGVCSKTRGTTKDGSPYVKYTLNLKEKSGLYGFKVTYDKGLILTLRKPFKPNKTNADMPLLGAKIAIDPGHGSSSKLKSTGAWGPAGKLGYLEADINLLVSLKLKSVLEGMGATVMMTREVDDYVTLDDRVKNIRAFSPDFAVSVHCNSVDFNVNTKNQNGTIGFYTYNFAAIPSKVLTTSVSETIRGTGQTEGFKDSGARFANFALTRMWEFPSVLMELMFMTNPHEYEWLCVEYNQQVMADALADGILKYLYAESKSAIPVGTPDNSTVITPETGMLEES